MQFDALTTGRERKAHPGACCYHWVIPCPGGRALRGSEGAIAAESVRRGDFIANVRGAREGVSSDRQEGSGQGREGVRPRAGTAIGGVREVLARHWEREAGMEHASIAAFARASLSLISVGAPAELLKETHAAAMDEVEHARVTYGLAALYSGVERGPGGLDLGSLSEVASSLVGVATETFVDACLGESVAAISLREAAARAEDPGVREVLSRIAEDEERHAELAWRTVAWALATGGDAVREALLQKVREVEIELLSPAGEAPGEEMDLSAHGVLGAREQREVRRRALAEVVLPCARGLLLSGVRELSGWREKSGSHQTAAMS
ncbi:MAG: ferritin-like domain-containing protein [Polyangiaceae bacterium]